MRRRSCWPPWPVAARPRTTTVREAPETRGTAQEKATDPTAKGPAPEVDGAKKGGTITVLSDVTPDTLDPTNIYFTDGNQIGKLMYRALTQYKLDPETGKPDLVPGPRRGPGHQVCRRPDLDVQAQAGHQVHGRHAGEGGRLRVRDQAVLRARPVRRRTDVPERVLQGRQDPQGSVRPNGANYAGVETPDESTLVIKLAKKFDDLPFYAAFPMFTPIPQAKDTKKTYDLKPMATGPYQVDSYTPGAAEAQEEPELGPEHRPGAQPVPRTPGTSSSARTPSRSSARCWPARVRTRTR